MAPSRGTLIGILAFIVTALGILGNAAFHGAAPFA